MIKIIMSRYFLFFITVLLAVLIITLSFLPQKPPKLFSRAAAIKANIRVNTRSIVGPLVFNWKSLAQGGEEPGVRMLANVTSQVAALSPQYIRIDHVYDSYNVVSRDQGNNLVFNWSQLDATVCDILATGAKPFFSLGYMPSVLSTDGTPIGLPRSWNEWSLVVQKTIERYSGINTSLCGKVNTGQTTDIYYEVWNEPDLASFGQWSIAGGSKDYRLLYQYTSQGALLARNVNHFLLGGPATSALLPSWIQNLLDYLIVNKLRLDFISWHHYSAHADDFANDVTGLTILLSDQKYLPYRSRPLILSEWGYDALPNPVANTGKGAAHTVAVIRNLVGQNVTQAFTFEIKDGLTPSWGILTHNGQKKPRYYALQMLNLLDQYRLAVDGEGTFVQALASIQGNKITAILVNYDKDSQNVESVPVTFSNLAFGDYFLTTIDLQNNTTSSTVTVSGNQLTTSVTMPPNTVTTLQLRKK